MSNSDWLPRHSCLNLPFKRDLRTRDAECIEIDGGIVEHLLCTVTNLSLKHQTELKIKLTVGNLSFFITTHNAFVFVESNSSISVTIQN